MYNKLWDRYRALRARREAGDAGFTLIELLVVVVIIAILVAIAIPIYLHFQQGAEKDSAKSDTRNAIPTLQQCYTDAGNTWTGVSAAAQSGNTITLTCGTGPTETVNISPGNTMAINITTSPGSYTVATTNPDTGKTYTYDSTTGQTTES